MKTKKIKTYTIFANWQKAVVKQFPTVTFRNYAWGSIADVKGPYGHENQVAFWHGDQDSKGEGTFRQ